jgi:hypothetical protein
MAETPCTSAEARQLDFWLGEWDLSWPAEQAGGEPGETMTGTNRLTKLFGDCVIEENFSTSDASYHGRSLSVFDANAGIWRQTWVDSQGAYLVFTGGMERDEMILSTTPLVDGDQVIVNRMVFSDITPTSLYWRWQRTTDSGVTWSDNWTITYTRSHPRT